MNVLMRRWAYLKPDLLPIAAIIIAQLWLGFNYPNYMNLNAPFNLIASTISCIVCALLFVTIVAVPENRKPVFNFDDFYNDRITFFGKNMGGICFLLVSHSAMFVVWYYDLYKVSNSYYAVLYVQGVMVFALLDRSAKRYIKSMRIP